MTSVTHSPEIVVTRYAFVVSQLRTNALNNARVVAVIDTVLLEVHLSDVATPAFRDIPASLGKDLAQDFPIRAGQLLTQVERRAGDRGLRVNTAVGSAPALGVQPGDSVVAVEPDAKLARSMLADRAIGTKIKGPLEAGYAASAPNGLRFIDGAVEALLDFFRSTGCGRVVARLADRIVILLAARSRTGPNLNLFDFADVECVALPPSCVPVRYLLVRKNRD